MHMATELKKEKQNPKPQASLRFWLIKFAPFRTAWPEIVRRGLFTPRGIRSPEARNNLKAMKKGDQVLFYQSQRNQAVVGILEVVRTAYSDPTGTDPQWLTCDFRPVRTLPRPVPLSEIKADPSLTDIPLIRQPRLAVMPLTSAQFQKTLNHSKGEEPL
jgi:predicted RNA-binding protein with PUA-like domain